MKCAFTWSLSHFDEVQTGRAARVAQIGLRVGAGGGQREAGARFGQVDGDVAQIASLRLLALGIASIQVELVLTDGHMPNILGQRLRLAEPHDHADRPALER